ncbi:MAG: family 43 glycosylhydrolase [Planctomycetota bacterium]
MPDHAYPYHATDGRPDRPLAAGLQRAFDRYPAPRPEDNPLFTNFRYTPLEGFDDHNGDGTVSRRDPSKVLYEHGRYYVWYTKRQTATPPVGMGRAREATDTIASADWDLAEVWYATSDDGFRWREQGPAFRRPDRPAVGWRSNCTPDVLKWRGRFYLYYQAFVEPSGLRGDHCPVAVAHADSPDGPWTRSDRDVLPNGPAGSWDQFAIHDPHPLVHDGKVYCYYKSAYDRPDRLTLGLGLAIADDPLGPFEKHSLNPLINSGHETALFPFERGVAALMIRDGNEHYTVQYAPDWVNFEIASIVEFPPTAAGLFVPDAFDDSGEGQGVTWGLCHFVNAGTPTTQHSILARVDCELTREPHDPAMKSTHRLHKPEFYFDQGLSPEQRARAERNARAFQPADAGVLA